MQNSCLLKRYLSYYAILTYEKAVEIPTALILCSINHLIKFTMSTPPKKVKYLIVKIGIPSSLRFPT